MTSHLPRAVGINPRPPSRSTTSRAPWRSTRGSSTSATWSAAYGARCSSISATEFIALFPPGRPARTPALRASGRSMTRSAPGARPSDARGRRAAAGAARLTSTTPFGNRVSRSCSIDQITVPQDRTGCWRRWASPRSASVRGRASTRCARTGCRRLGEGDRLHDGVRAGRVSAGGPRTTPSGDARSRRPREPIAQTLPSGAGTNSSRPCPASGRRCRRAAGSPGVAAVARHDDAPLAAPPGARARRAADPAAPAGTITAACSRSRALFARCGPRRASAAMPPRPALMQRGGAERDVDELGIVRVAGDVVDVLVAGDRLADPGAAVVVAAQQPATLAATSSRRRPRRTRCAPRRHAASTAGPLLMAGMRLLPSSAASSGRRPRCGARAPARCPRARGVTKRNVPAAPRAPSAARRRRCGTPSP